jgi:multidrug efflux system membrane fusion protein
MIFAALLVAGCSKKVEKPRPKPAALVVTDVSSQRDVPLLLKAIGTMEASESVTIKTQISGEITRVSFREGQEVQKGALLFQLDPRIYLAAVKKAEASLARNKVVVENARKDYERYSQLVREGIVTQEQAEGYRTRSESAAADFAADQANLENARAQLAYCTITAPISGTLGVLAVDRGNVVKANETALVTINRISPLHVSFTIPEKELSAVVRQMSAGRLVVEAEVPGANGFREKGMVSFVDNTVDPTTGTIKLKGIFDNRQKRLWPGQFVNLSILLSMKKNAVVVPSQALQTGQKGVFVFVVKSDATAEIRPVVTGPSTEGLTVIEQGLKAGEQIVIDGQMRVVPGAKVEVKMPDKAGVGKASPTPEAKK